MADKAYLERLSRELTDQGKLIEAGWIGFRIAALPLDMGADELAKVRDAFMAGAQHTFGSIMVVLDPLRPPNGNEVGRVTNIARELKTFMSDFTKHNNLNPEKPREHLAPH